MAKTLSTHISHKSALALIPPSTIAPPIQAVRRVHDKQFKRWPPHINLLYPFLSSPSQGPSTGEDSSPCVKEGIRERIEKVVRDIEPFRVSLIGDAPGIFSHGRKSKTVWLGPSTEAIQQLQASLQTEFSECDADQRPFKPHLSMGQAQSKDEANLLSGIVTKSVLNFLSLNKESAQAVLEWEIDRVFVIERQGYEDPFEVIGTIQLGTKKNVQPLSTENFPDTVV